MALDPQLICYSWFRGISDAAVVAFVRKRVPEIQYLKTKITDEQRREFGQLVRTTVSQIEGRQFLPHSGIRFPQNGCVSCAELGLCLGNQQLVDAKLIRLPGASNLDSLPYLWHVWDSGIMKQEAVRTTVDIPTSLYRRLKEQAAAQGRSVRELILAGARSTLVEGKRPRPKRVRFPLIISKGPKVNLTNEHIYEYVEFP